MIGAYKYLRLRIKLFLRNHILMRSFCKVCGCDIINDWECGKETWDKINRYIKDGNVCCVACAIDILNRHYDNNISYYEVNFIGKEVKC